MTESRNGPGNGKVIRPGARKGGGARTFDQQTLPSFAPTISPVDWTPSYRLIPSRFPPIDLFERVANPADWEAIMLVESLTNSRLRDQVGEISLVPSEHRVSGPDSSYIMAPFTHLSVGGRFSTPRFGAYYAGLTLGTALRETIYHRERFLRATNEKPTEIDMREVQADLHARLHDIRSLKDRQPALYDEASYAHSQPFATQLRAAGAEGIVYDSVRDAGGECVAVFIPKLLTNARQGAHYCYVWDGRQIAAYYLKSGLRAIGTVEPTDGE